MSGAQAVSASPLVAHPAMHPAATGENKEDVLEAEILAQPGIQYLQLRRLRSHGSSATCHLLP